MKATFLFLSICISLSAGAVFSEPPNPNAGRNKCLSTIYPGVELKYGQSKEIPNKCIFVSCEHDGSIKGSSCGPFSAPPGCYDANLSKSFPRCCGSRIKC